LLGLLNEAAESYLKFTEKTTEGFKADQRLREIYDRRKANKDNFHSGHFSEPNVLAHTRLNDRVDSDGKRVLFVEEIQSDWHQAGRKKGV
jgi:hypothetical protein